MEDQRKQARSYIFARLARRSLLSHEARKILREKGFEEQIIEEVLADLIDKQYLNDEEWISRYLEKNKKKYGMRLLVWKLKQKGVTSEEIDPLLTLHPLDEEEEIREKIKDKNLSDQKEKRKVIAKLIRSGYNPSLVYSLILSN